MNIDIAVPYCSYEVTSNCILNGVPTGKSLKPIQESIVAGVGNQISLNF